MSTKTGKTKSEDRIELFIDEENKRYIVLWVDLCGYDTVSMEFAFATEAEAFFNAVLKVIEIDAD
jgi:hypothetical protein